MLFNTIQYGVFFLVVYIIHWIIPQSWRRPFLLCASYYFYASAIPQYLFLILGLTTFNYLIGRWISGLQGRMRKTGLILAVVGNLGSLAYFKYTEFILSSVQPLLKVVPVIGSSFTDPLLVNILLPLGISFFTFEFIHYNAEIFKGKAPIKNPVDFALFAAFFPTQIAGPIKRFPDWIKQIQHPLAFREVDVDRGIWLVLRGLLKKVVVADTLSPVIGVLFTHATGLGAGTAWFAIFAFSTQIYCDFSGYTDIGRGCAMLLGYSVPENFKSPYQSAKVGEFWDRWHISLSTWLRDYLFIPLGGSRVAPGIVYLNLMITMALGGLWHGASWHFMVWGVYQGVLLCANRFWDRSIGKIPTYQQFIKNPIINFMRRPITLLFVCTGWLIFRADTLTQAWQIFNDLFHTNRPLWAGFVGNHTSSSVLLLLGAAVVVIIGWVRATAQEAITGQPTKVRQTEPSSAPGNVGWLGTAYALVARPAIYTIAFMIVVLWPQFVAVKFIYFQF